MVRFFPLPALLLCAVLTACAPGGVGELNFRAGPPGVEVNAARLLEEQVVPADKLLTLKEAVARAPEGSLIVACGRRWSWLRPWGICTHVSRKLAPGLLTEAPGITGGGLLRGGPRTIPEERLESRDLVIVLDVGVRPDQMPALRAEAKRLEGVPYRIGDLLNGDPRNGVDCSTYQNDLQRAVGLPDVVPRHGAWNLYLPQDALEMPGARVLWVGVRGGQG